MTAEDVSLTPSTESAIWRGAVDWVAAADGLRQPWRLLPGRAARAHAPGLINTAQMAAGVRAELRTDASAVGLRIRAAEPALPVDVLVDGERVARLPVEPGTHDLQVPLPEGAHDVEVWLPQGGITQVGDLVLSGADLVEAPAPALRWTTYGSSITQAQAAFGPSETWPALVARRLGWDLTCLGFSGQCHLDPIAARTIAAVPADVVSLCLGINIQGNGSFNERSLAPQVSGFIEQVREAHPDAAIAVLTPILSPPREETPNVAGLTLEAVRAAVRAAVTELQAEDANLHLFEGPTVIGTEDVHLLPDDLHPDGEGYRLMADRIAPLLSRLPLPVGVR
ncbi:GDSL-type esterase/lipase family protein [Occultella kanbiaonis]|uniref:GDSL-type esterase/lipase family protein n=1 Tax=Occultella kanbiaonis TaxID=2675754 RepID=UPI0012B76152|nr:GDSL-type esterase/lipase family protein [Occultella kanbiaonis]